MERISALVTVYYPSPSVPERVRKIAKQVERIFVCDNTPISNQKLFQDISNIIYCFWGENRGISAAFNTILKEPSYGWTDEDFVIFFDQDSTISDDFIVQIIDEYKHLLTLGAKIGCFGPIYYNRSNHTTEVAHMKKLIYSHTYCVNTIITSSMLCQYCTLKEVNFWNEEIFLDLSDFDLCWRFKKRGYLCYVSDKLILDHIVGVGEKKIGTLKLRVWSPIREYYQIRDCLKLMNKEYVPLKFKLRSVIFLTLGTIAKLLLLNKPKERFYYMKKGFCDYYNGINGEMP